MIEKLIGLSHWQIDLLVIYLFVQGAFFTVFPEEVILPTLGVLWGQGRISFAEAFAAAAFGLVCGDVILMLLGRHLGVRLLVKRPFSWVIDAEMLEYVQEKMRRYGTRLVFFVRFIPSVRAPTFFAAGISRMPFPIFLRSDLAGLAIWIPLLFVFGRHLGSDDVDCSRAAQARSPKECGEARSRSSCRRILILTDQF
jgi:membrane protein DedA with SNARE-associated domain